MPHIHPDTPFEVYAPGATMWRHPRLTWWGVWLRTHGWWGWLPWRGVRDCYAFYPSDRTCACGMYHIQWEEIDFGRKEYERKEARYHRESGEGVS